MKETLSICKQGEIDNLSVILKKKAKEVQKKMQNLQIILQNLEEEMELCNHIQKHLNQFSVQCMEPFMILGELTDSKAFSEYDRIHDRKRKEATIIKSIMREFCFSNQELISNRMLIIEQLTKKRILLKRMICVSIMNSVFIQ